MSEGPMRCDVDLVEHMLLAGIRPTSRTTPSFSTWMAAA